MKINAYVFFMSGAHVFFLLCDVAPFMLYKESRGGAWFACLAWFHDNSSLSKRITVNPFIHPSVGPPVHWAFIDAEDASDWSARCSFIHLCFSDS